MPKKRTFKGDSDQASDAMVHRSWRKTKGEDTDRSAVSFASLPPLHLHPSAN